MPGIHKIILAVVAVAITHVGAHAQEKPEDYPTKPVRLVAASPPGGGIDIIARITAQKLSETWPQQVIVENRPGAANTLATGLVVKAPPDGYTLLLQSMGVAYAGALRELPFDALRDLAPVALVASQPSMLGTHSSVPSKSVREFIQLARSKPGRLTYGSAGPGGASHLSTELLASMAGVRFVLVQYRGIGPAMTGLLSGEVDFGMLGISTMLPHVESGKIRALGVTGAKRSALVPDVPTIAEAGVPGYGFDAWYAVLAPVKTPRAVLRKINADVNRVLQQPDTRQRLSGLGMEPLGGSEEEFAQYFRAEVAKWHKVIKDAGIREQ